MLISALLLGRVGWILKLHEFRAAVRRRIGVDVRIECTECPACNLNRCDVKDDHAVSCAGWGDGTLKHNSLVVILANVIKNAGFRCIFKDKGDIESNKKRSGDIGISNFDGGKKTY